MKAILLITLLAVAPTPASPKPNQDKAIQIVWRDMYGMNIPPPTIIWVEGKELNCGKGRTEDGRIVGSRKNKGFVGWLDLSATDTWPPCVYGTFTPHTNTIRLSWPRGTTRFSTTAFSHELAHARAWADTGAFNHQGYDFAPRGRAALADRALRKQGL